MVKRVNAQLSDEAWAGWHAFARYHGVSVTALLEVAGQILDTDAVDVRTRRWVAAARVVDEQRRKRPR